MEEKRYRVIFRGELAEGAQIDAVKEKLAAAFKKDPDSIEQLFSGEEKLIKKNAPLDACMKIRSAFQKAGAHCVIEPEGSREAAEGAGGETPPPLPEREAGAGTKGPGDRFCSHCGAVINAGTQFCPECGVKKRE